MQRKLASGLAACLLGSIMIIAPSFGGSTASPAALTGSGLEPWTTTLTAIESSALPPGTTVDRLEWRGNILHLDLTMPAGQADWQLTPLEMEALHDKLAEPFVSDATYGGTVIRARAGSHQPYRALDDFVPTRAAAPIPDSLAATPEAGAPVRDQTAPSPGAGGGDRSPVTQAARQPAGALSGVTVFASCGHGWTARDTYWGLQRGILHVMNEDYGNIDQLNQFVHYAYNAGATVVPFRPVGWQHTEIVLDNDDPGVSFTGTWNNSSTSGKYYENNVTVSGIPYKWANSSTTETATARYTPVIPETGFYPVYCFTKCDTDRIVQTYRIRHSGGVAEVAIDHRLVGRGWIWLGEYYLEASGENWVEISNASDVSGVAIADAIRWGNGIGDIPRTSQDEVSGYPRDEECQRYWAHSELGNNSVGFSASEIWDSSATDENDNVTTGARWAREMNFTAINNDRWRRVHLEFHTNAATGTARGAVALESSSYPTTYQTEYASFMVEEIDTDMQLLEDQFEHTWYDRGGQIIVGGYGAISTYANGNEFDSTIIELAFHDNEQDAQLLRDCRVRSAMARSCVQGIIRFLNSLPDSTVPLAFPPHTPRAVRAEDAGGGDVVLTWQAPLSGDAYGDPATGYVIYESSNGYGFGNPIILGDTLSTTVSGVPVGQTRYYRIAATNDGGESMPSEVLAVRRPGEGTAPVVIVNGFDRLRRQQNPTQWIGNTIERQIWRRTNSYDYVVQHAEALADAGVGFGTCANEAVIDGSLALGDYDIAVWILGAESVEDSTFNSSEQTRVTNFLNDGGALFVSGAEIGYDLIGQGHGVTFLQSTLQTGYSTDDAGTDAVTGASSGILSDVGPFDFDPANGAPYIVYAPDVLTAQSDALACLNYVGGSGGVAGVQYTGAVYNAVVFGFPFETITSAAVRADIMLRVINFLETATGPLPFDYDRDGDVDHTDYLYYGFCQNGPLGEYPDGHFCREMDGDDDTDVDLADFALLQEVFTGR